MTRREQQGWEIAATACIAAAIVMAMALAMMSA